MMLPFNPIFLIAPLTLLPWIVALGGFSAITAKCNDTEGFTGSDCGHNHGLKWFSVIFQLVLIVLLVVASVLQILHRLRLVLLSYLTIAAGLFIFISDELVKTVYFNENVLKNKEVKAFEAYGAAAAGAVLLCLVNFLLIVYVSLADNVSDAPRTTRQAPPVAQKAVNAPAPAPGPVSAEASP